MSPGGSGAEGDTQGHIAGMFALKSHESDFQRRSAGRTDQPLFRNRKVAVIDLSPRVAVQSALIDACDMVFYADAKILRFERHIVHVPLSHALQ
jgi:hypothetical protein